MAKKVTGYIKLQIPAGKATPAPPVGPALGQSFCRVDLLCRFLIQRVGTKAVNGLRRERHETAVFQDLSRL